MKRYRYEFGGYVGDQLVPMMEAIVRDAQSHPDGADVGVARLRELLDGLASLLRDEGEPQKVRLPMSLALLKDLVTRLQGNQAPVAIDQTYVALYSEAEVAMLEKHVSATERDLPELVGASPRSPVTPPICGATKNMGELGVAECQRPDDHTGAHVSGDLGWVSPVTPTPEEDQDKKGAP